MASAADIALNAWEEPEPDRAGMTDEEIVAILRDQERAAVSFRDTVLAGEQAAAIDFYEAEPFGDEEEGRSQVIVPDVAEVVDYTQISLIRNLAGADRVVEFEPGDTEDMADLPEPPEEPQMPPQQDGQPLPPEAQQAMQAYQQQRAQYDAAMAQHRRWERARDKAADDATAAVNHIFMRKQNGYRVLVDFIQSGLIEKIGILKVAAITELKKVKSNATMSEQDLAVLMDQGAEVTNSTQNPDGSITVTVANKSERVAFQVYPVPSEEFIFTTRSRDEDSGPYYAHRSRKTISDLIGMDFDRDTVENLPPDDGATAFDDARGYARWRDDDMRAFNGTVAMREVMLMEEYARLDMDGDGIAELWQVFRVGDVILSMEEMDENPFVVWTPFPRAHRLVGNSTAEKVMDIQRINSVLLRQALDGVYLTNRPRTWLPDEATTENTIDDLLSPYPGTIVRGRGSLPPQKMSDAFDIQKSLGMLEYMTGMRESRTGITRLNQGLDEDTINKTASGQAALRATGQQMEEYQLRNCAEALARMFGKLLRLMKVHGSQVAIKVDGNYRKVDPASWDDDMNVVVRVGLGSGSKEQRLIMRQQVGQQQAEALQAGLPIVDPKRIYANAVGFVRDAALGNPDDYWLDPDSDEFKRGQAGKQEKPDPEMAKVQAQAQTDQMRVHADMQRAQGEQSLKAQQMASDAQLKARAQDQELQQRTAAAELDSQLKRDAASEAAQLARDRAASEADRAERQFEFQSALAIRQAEFQEALAERQASHRESMTEEGGVSKLRPGGDLDK